MKTKTRNINELENQVAIRLLKEIPESVLASIPDMVLAYKTFVEAVAIRRGSSGIPLGSPAEGTLEKSGGRK